MHFGTPSRAPQPPFRFTLRQGVVALGVVCVFVTASYWVGAGPVLFLSASLGSIALVIYFATRGRLTESALTLFLGGILTYLLLPAVQHVPLDYTTTHCRSNLHNLALALQQYESVNGSFPPAYIADADGKPMHSWRVLLLPYVEHNSIYKQYRFDEPWNGPNNSTLAVAVPKISYYDCSLSSKPGETSYLAVAGPQTIWPGATSTKMSDIKDGPANTILLVEVHHSGIHWMEPRDLDIAQMPMTVNSAASLSISSGHRHSGAYANIVFADGRLQHLRNNTPAKSLRAALTISGGEKDKLPTARLRR